MDPDHRLLLTAATPLLQSRNSAVVIAVVNLFLDLAPPDEVNVVVQEFGSTKKNQGFAPCRLSASTIRARKKKTDFSSGTVRIFLPGKMTDLEIFLTNEKIKFSQPVNFPRSLFLYIQLKPLIALSTCDRRETKYLVMKLLSQFTRHDIYKCFLYKI